MDYDDIDYDEGYSMKDINDNWSNSDMDYETDSDSDSDMDNYNYTNNWSTFTDDKINRQTNKNNDSFLDRINRKLESLENIDRSAIYTKVEKKNDSFLDLYERIKALNSPLKKEIEFEPHHRSSFTETMTDNWYINNSLKEDIDKNLQTLKATDRLVDEETGPIKERIKHIEDKLKDLTKERNTIENDRLKEMVEKQNNKEVSSLVQIICKKLDTDRQKSLIETSKKESLHKKLIDNNKEIIKKGMVEEMKEMFEKQNSEDVGKVIIKDMQKPKTNSIKESLCRKIEVE